MTTEPLSREMVAPLGTGLVLMAVFTAAWATWPLSYQPASAVVALSVAFCLFAAVLGINGFSFMTSLQLFSPAADQAPFARVNRRYNLVFVGEMAAIGISSGVLNATGLERCIPSAIALIVGLHYIALSRVFGGRLYVWIGCAVSLVAGLGVLVVAGDEGSMHVMSSIVEFATAGSTAGFGIAMLRAKRAALASRTPGQGTAATR